MTQETPYDVIVIGMGPGGEAVVAELQEAGLRIAAIEKELVGGECAYWACIPSKTLLRPGSIQWEAKHGVGISEPRLTWPEIARYRNYMSRDWDDAKQVEDLQRANVDFYRGEAKVAGPERVAVDGRVLEGKNIVIATGSEASVPPIEGLKEAAYWTNREATAFQDVPKSVLVLGGGAVGSELGQVFRAYGAGVTIVDEAKQLLSRENPEAAKFVQTAFKAAGIKLLLGRKARKFERRGGEQIATLDDGANVSAEVVLVATGRRPRVENLGLETVGIKPGQKGIQVDASCRASDGVWAVGDVTGVAGFTHLAHYQGQIVASNILGEPRKANYDDIPAVTFTNPEIASVGVSDTNRAPEGVETIEAFVDLNSASRTYTYGERLQGGLGLLGDKRKKILIGAWAVGPLAGEWIHFGQVAIRAKVPIDILSDTMPAFPTFSRLYLRGLKDLRKQLA